MNSSLPFLIDAIFGKNDLQSVSREELIDVISEFPSFNAAHYLLSQKLSGENHPDFEKASRITALYFNNPLWLEALLKETNGQSAVSLPILEETNGQTAIDLPIEKETVAEIPAITELVSEPLAEEPVIPETTPEFVPEPVISSGEEPKPFTGTVSSFDDLISKYKIEETESVSADPPQIVIPAPEPDTNASSGSSEHREEVLNEYGIFDETAGNDPDDDQDSFDRQYGIAEAPAETVQADIPHIDIPAAETENIVENQQPDISYQHTNQDDYDAFDKPAQEPETAEEVKEPTSANEISADQMEAEANDTSRIEEIQPADSQLDDLVTRFGEKQKALPLFDAKKAESIVFTPYHMIDYFASQGIKLVLEDQPADSFGRQLKSFTEWLKVMKKLPVQPAGEKQNEREADQIRHFAAHSIEERDILTESMAEVLAKQGMYENAIALFQKLSLIYPPKSAYFASRIEQLKASLP